MLPVKKPTNQFCTLDEIRQRKVELAEDLQRDSTKVSTLWNQIFVKREDSSHGEYIAGIIANSITAIDTFLLVRKLFKNYGHLFGWGASKKRK